ncbi:MAG: hypothetical protein GF320_05810 [Armatimonadia bacterium]|nr:hypothetical protein [Armatimonadia bacterium]
MDQALPIGTVLAYAGDLDDLPQGWMLCDGSTINLRQSPWRGRRVPDLTGRYLRGLQKPTETDALGRAGGREVARHTHSIEHTHVGVTFESEWSDADTGNGSGQADMAPSGGPRAHIHSYATSEPVPSTSSGSADILLNPSFVGVNFIMKVA